jgi:hypothetical protein
LERVQEISLIEMLLEMLPARVGSPLSIKSLREDLEVSHATAQRWVQILERLYVCFRIAPYGAKKIRAVKKEKKLYFWDWAQIAQGGLRFENMVACQLLKYCHYLEDSQGYRMELQFLRDTDKREVDFVVLKEGAPLFAVECKTGDRKVSPFARYFRQRTPILEWYQVHLGKNDFGHAKKDIRVLPFHRFCTELELP